jgi:predicted ABC-type ATPase
MGQSRPLKPVVADKPVFFLLAGPNGAGKSTLYKAQVLAGTIPANAEFVNADVYEATQLQHISDPLERSEQARLWADAAPNY